MLLLRPVLDQRTGRHDEKTAKEAECGKKRKDRCKGEPGSRQQESENRDARGAERNQAIFDFSAGEVTCRKAAKAEADRNRGLQKADFGRADVQDIAAVENDVELKKRAE